MADDPTTEIATLTKGPDGVPGSAEAWASGLRGAVLTGLMTSPFAAEAGEIRAAVMRDLYAEVDRIAAAARTDERERLVKVIEAHHPSPHWCHDADEQPNVYEGDVLWPCPTLAALAQPAGPCNTPGSPAAIEPTA